MAKELITVELIENPAVTRLMTVASYQNNQHKWRIAGSVETPKAEAQKKSVEPVAVVEPAAIVAKVDSPFVDPTGPELATAEPLVPPSAHDIAPTGLIDGLRAQYKAMSGKEADGRWGVKKLSEEIKLLETPAPQ